jgi:glycosyltransferase involved in cell wall biosynthesis
MRLHYKTENNRPGFFANYHEQKNEVRNKTAHSFPLNLHTPVIKVSAVIITYNEEVIIERTLSQLWWCDEILVIDSGSSDSTVSICEKYGCSIFYRSFTGFGEQKKYGVSKAKNDWILCIDADEVLTESLVEEIRSEIGKDKIEYTGFSMPRKLVFMNKVFSHGKEANSGIIRLFNKKYGNWDGAVVHEKIILTGHVKKLSNKILHYSYHDYSQFILKINLYSTLGAKKLFLNKCRKNKLIVALGIPFNFLKYYFFDRNFLNGYRGFAWSVLNTFYHFVKYLKLKELENRSNS